MCIRDRMIAIPRTTAAEISGKPPLARSSVIAAVPDTVSYTHLPITRRSAPDFL